MILYNIACFSILIEYIFSQIKHICFCVTSQFGKIVKEISHYYNVILYIDK